MEENNGNGLLNFPAQYKLPLIDRRWLALDTMSEFCDWTPNVEKEIEKITDGVIVGIMSTLAIAKSDILGLSVSERIQLAEDIWDSVVEVPQSVPLTEAEKAELDSRLDAYHQNPGAGSPWSIVKERIRSKR